MSKTLRPACLASILSLTACNVSTSGTLEALDQQCAQSNTSTLFIAPRDADTNASLSCDATVYLRGRGQNKVLHHPDADTAQCDADYEFSSEVDAGYYDVMVEVYGYEPWAKQGVEVADQECQPQGLLLRIALSSY